MVVLGGEQLGTQDRHASSHRPNETGRAGTPSVISTDNGAATVRVSVLLDALAGLAVTTMFAVMSYQAWHQDAVLSDRGQQATARVVTARKSVQVEFRTADGRQVKAFLGEGDEDPGPRSAVCEQG